MANRVPLSFWICRRHLICLIMWFYCVSSAAMAYVGSQTQWFSSYLSGCKLTAKVTTRHGRITYSNAYDITCGMAQGSCLGPLLFIIFCNDVQLLPLIGSLILFTDDTTLSNNHRNVNYLEYSLKHDMGLLLDWFQANKLTLNLNKTVMMQFWPKKEERLN